MIDAVAIVDASALIGLARIGRLALLERLFRQVVAPGAVLAEVASDPKRPGAAEVSAACAAWLVERQPLHTPLAPHGLGPGEWECIVLAREEISRGNRVRLVLDEARGRAFAKLLGLPLTGVLGILLAARQAGELPAPRPALDDLRAIGFRLGDALYHEVLRAAGEET